MKTAEAIEATVVDERESHHAKSYDEYVRQHAPLSKEQERELLIRKDNAKGEQKEKARSALIDHNQRLVLKLAHHYNGCISESHEIRSMFTFTDLVNSGNIGLAEAVDKFDANNHKTRFSTYAVPRIRLHMLRLLYSSSPISAPKYVREKLRQYKSIRKAADKNGSIASDESLRKELGTTRGTLAFLKIMDGLEPIYLNEVLSEGETGGTERIEVVADHYAEDPFEVSAREDLYGIVRKEVEALPAHLRKVVEARLLMNKSETTLKQIGEQSNVTGERIRQREIMALEVLRTRLRQKHGISGLNL